MKKLLIALLLLLSGCASQNLTGDERTRTYDVECASVFGAVVQALTFDGYSVQEADRGSGVIVTGPRIWNETLATLGNTTTKTLTVLVRPDGESSRVTLSFYTQQEGKPVTLMKGAQRKMYQEVFGLIEDGL